jgi:hypothetical protein
VCVDTLLEGRKGRVTCGAKEIERKLSDELGVDRIVQFYQKQKELGLTKEVPTRERDFLIEIFQPPEIIIPHPKQQQQKSNLSSQHC